MSMRATAERGSLEGMDVARTDLSFPAHGGPQSALWFGPRDARCIVAIVPALGLRADYYAALAEALVRTSQGQVAAITFDHPGHGKSPIRASRSDDWGYAEVVAHLAALRRTVRGASQGTFVWLGHSIGGQVALMDAEHADAVVLVASGTPYFRAWSGTARARILLGTGVSGVLGRLFGHYPGESVGFGGREARSLIAQWARIARTGRYVFGAFDGDAAMARARVPVHAVAIEGDTLAPQAAVDHALSKLSSARISRATFARAAQGELARGNQHNRWPRFPAFAVEQTLSFLGREGCIALGEQHVS